MNIENVKNPVFSNPESSAIDCIVKFDAFAEELPFNASENDTAEHGKALYARLISGEFGPIGEFVPEIPVVTNIPQAIVDGAQAL